MTNSTIRNICTSNTFVWLREKNVGLPWSGPGFGVLSCVLKTKEKPTPTSKVNEKFYANKS